MVDFLTTEVCIHPTSVLSIIQFHERRDKSKKNVIGTLFGERKADKVTVSSAFVVNHKVTEGEPVSIDFHGAEQYSAYYRRAHPYDSVVGWFSTSANVSEDEKNIHEFYGCLCKQPVLVTLDTSLPETKLDIKAYTVTSFGLGESNLGYMFSGINTKVAWEPQEKSLVDLITSLQTDKYPQRSDPDIVLNSLIRMQNYVKFFMDYVKDVVDNKKVGNPEIGRQLMSMLKSIPRIPRSELDTMFNTEKNDLLATGYLIQWIQDYLPMHDHAINKSLKAFH
ncbi:hypothetical protein GJ496_011494 [Pomphorhynchus laevis]|nr:hypothetical protein GJ496_011494 [Pomphorhynchus laevis]